MSERLSQNAKGGRPRQSRRPSPAVGAPSIARKARKARATHANFAVVGIGASAGGLDACRKLLDALPAGAGLALILVQHLDPTHESMMVDLLAGHTAMTVRQATDGMSLERNHFYVGDGSLGLK